MGILADYEWRAAGGELFGVFVFERTGLLAGLQWWFRDVWLQTLAAPVDLLGFPQLKKTGEAVAKRISPKEALENVQVVEQTQRLLHTNVQEALALEVGLLKLKL